MARDFILLPVSFQCSLSYGVHTAPNSNHMHNICVDVKRIQNICSHTIVWSHENTAHTLIGMCSATLAAVVPYPGKVA